ncbi:MAG: hypothetical protein M9932_04710 [Xanthobacteraceae bacterium]|nr:hypothetical protein [Xanthobacteraceae bacterium]
MFRLTALSLAWIGLTVAAHAADLPAYGRLGEIFVEPPPRVAAPRPLVKDFETVYAPEVDIPPLVNGYYGKPNSFRYRSYYGTPPHIIFGRLPYACGRFGYC